MKHKIDDNDLSLLFKTNKKEIPDNGFSKKVSQKLPSSNNFYAANYLIWTIATVIAIAVISNFLNFTENFYLFFQHISEKFTDILILFFKNPKIYLTTFLALLVAGSFFAIKEKGGLKNF